MSILNKKKSKLIRIINDKNLCISNNPLGIDINWPKSFAKLYYSKSLDKVYRRKKSPIVLEINQSNEYKEKLWKYFFNNPIIFKENIYNQKDFNSSNNLILNKNFDIIIIQNYKQIDKFYKIINPLKEKLKPRGILIIENFYSSIPLVLKLFFFQETRIFDFRLDKFLIDNCIIEIKNNGLIFNILITFKNFYSLINHLLLELLYTLIYKIKKNFFDKK